jgi:REP element-mobilizing transposase RayT/DNA-binding MarR family transcriptional regulator
MSRPLRISFNNAVYHITARGNRRDKIFYSDGDKKIFLQKMDQTFLKYSFLCYAYCLMDNHYHLFIKTSLGNISQGMHYLNASYANYFAAKYKTNGPLFQGRYKSLLVDEDNYALILSSYIHLNPLRAGLTKNLEEYTWSSLLDYLGKRKKELKKLDTQFILNRLHNNLTQSRTRYKRYLLENLTMDFPVKDIYRGIALGDETFIERIESKIKAVGEKREIQTTKYFNSYSSEEIIQKVSQAFSLTKGEVLKKQRGNLYRQVTLYLVKKYSSLSLKEIGKILGMDYTAVSQATRRFEDKIRKDNKIRIMVNSVLKLLKN